MTQLDEINKYFLNKSVRVVKKQASMSHTNQYLLFLIILASY